MTSGADRPDPYSRELGTLWRDDDGDYWRLEATTGFLRYSGVEREWASAKGATRAEFATQAEADEYEDWLRSTGSSAHLALEDLRRGVENFPHRPPLTDHPMRPSTRLMPGGYYVNAWGQLFRQDAGAPYRLAPVEPPRLSLAWALLSIGFVILIPSGLVALLIGQSQVGAGFLVVGALLLLIVGVRVWLSRHEDAARREADRVSKIAKELEARAATRRWNERR